MDAKKKSVRKSKAVAADEGSSSGEYEEVEYETEESEEELSEKEESVLPTDDEKAKSQAGSSQETVGKVDAGKQAKAATKIQAQARRKAATKKVEKIRQEKAAKPKPPAEKPATEKPATAKPATAKPATEKPAAAKPAQKSQVIHEGLMEVKSKKKQGVIKYFVLTYEEVNYYDSEQDYLISPEACKGHVLHEHIKNVEPQNGGFILHTEHSKKPLELGTSSMREWTRWRTAWQEALGSKYTVMAPEDPQLEAAATKVQASVRGKIARKKMPPKNQKAFEEMMMKKMAKEDESMARIRDAPFPWRRKASTRFAKIKGVSKFKEKDPSYGPPIPRGVQTPKDQGMRNMELTKMADLKFAFNMLDTEELEVLDRTTSIKFFRCLGWCIPDQDLSNILDEVDVEDLSPKKRARKPDRLRGPWSFDRLVRAQELLTQRKANASFAELQTALTHLAAMTEDENGVPYKKEKSKAGNTMSYAEFHRVCMGSLGGNMFSKDEFKHIVEAIWLWKGAPAVQIDKVVMRVLERIIAPPSAIDLTPEDVGIAGPTPDDLGLNDPVRKYKDPFML